MMTTPQLPYGNSSLRGGWRGNAKTNSRRLLAGGLFGRSAK
jgi:hypothetical protein